MAFGASKIVIQPNYPSCKVSVRSEVLVGLLAPTCLRSSRDGACGGTVTQSFNSPVVWMLPKSSGETSSSARLHRSKTLEVLKPCMRYQSATLKPGSSSICTPVHQAQAGLSSTIDLRDVVPGLMTLLLWTSACRLIGSWFGVYCSVLSRKAVVEICARRKTCTGGAAVAKSGDSTLAGR